MYGREISLIVSILEIQIYFNLSCALKIQQAYFKNEIKLKKAYQLQKTYYQIVNEISRGVKLTFIAKKELHLKCNTFSLIKSVTFKIK